MCQPGSFSDRLFQFHSVYPIFYLPKLSQGGQNMMLPQRWVHRSHHALDSPLQEVSTIYLPLTLQPSNPPLGPLLYWSPRRPPIGNRDLGDVAIFTCNRNRYVSYVVEDSFGNLAWESMGYLHCCGCLWFPQQKKEFSMLAVWATLRTCFTKGRLLKFRW